jgi:hypothetical protein
MTTPRLGLILAFGLTALTLTAGTAWAQPAPPPPPGYGYAPPPPPPRMPDRRGLAIGFSLGGGSYQLECGIACELFADERYEGFSGTFHIGGMLSPDMALLFDGWGIGYSPDEDRTLFHNIGTIALRYFVGPKLWLQGGLGWSNFSLSCTDDAIDPNCDESSETGGAAMVAAGLELFQTWTFALDVSVRFGVGAYEDGDVNMGSVQLGFNWY